MRESGTLIKVENGKATVKLQHRGGCSRCGLNNVCNPRNDGSRELTLKIDNNKLSPGEEVEVATSPKSYLLAAFVVFIFPLILSILVYGLVKTGTRHEHLALISFFIAFGLSEVIVWWLDKKIGRSKFFEPILTKKQG